jgi:hypothetical protein
MSIELYQRVILTRDISGEGLRRGDVATVVESHRDPSGNVIGYELELFSASGETLAVASAPVDAVRNATTADRLAARSA